MLILNKYVPVKTKILRASHVPYMIRTLTKAIMKQTQLGTKYLKNKKGINLNAYKKQRNFCSKLYKKETRKYCNKLNMNSITYNKEFQRIIKPFLIDEKGKLLSNEKKFAEIFCYQINTVTKLGINRDDDKFNGEPKLSTDSVDITTQKCGNLASVKLIRDNTTLSETF